MKEKIQLLSKGIFEYENPEIELSESAIDLELEYGGSYSGFFELTSLNHTEIRAMIFSSSQWMQCMESTFIGEKGSIHYIFDAQAMETDETAEGYFTIVSNGGEICIPWRVHICSPFKETSMGPMNDLDQFALLARENWAEALNVFNSEDFKRVFLRHKKHQRIYDVLIRSGNEGLAMEEFLCAVRRKQPVDISVSQDLIEIENVDHAVSGKLLIEKGQWGYVRVSVQTEGDFLRVYKQVITGEDFLGSYYQLEYEIYPEKGHQSEGRIILETFNQRLEISVRCSRERRGGERISRSRSLKKAWLDLNQNYLDMELNKISRSQWLSEAREDVSGCLNNSTDSIYRVVEADYYLMAGDKEEAGRTLETVNGRELRYRSAISYSYYLYVNARYRADEHYTEYVCDTIGFYAEGQCQNRWELLYMLIRLGGHEGSHQDRCFKCIREVYGKRGIGGILYLEAARMVNNDPSLVREMGDFEVSLFIWGVRHEVLSRESVFRFADLALRMRRYHAQCMYTLMDLCKLYETKDLLTAVIHLLILGEKKESRFHRWYELGIQSSVKIPELYEYYMATLNMDSCMRLPDSVLIYFQYDNRLGDDQKAFLYCYLVEHRGKLSQLFESYDGIIKAFTMDQLRKGRIDRNSAVLYRTYLTGDAMTPHVIQALPSVMFKQLIRCSHPGIKRVIVDYSELERELVYPMTDGKAVVDIFLDDYRILFEDADGGRYIQTVDYTIEKLLDPGQYIRECYEQCGDNSMVLLNRSERALKYQIMDEASIEICKQTLKLKNVSRQYQKTLLKNLIDYYYDNYEGETLEKYLLQIDLALLGHEERNHIIEYYIQRGLYERAYDAITTYGWEGVLDKRIMRLCSRIIRENHFAKEELLVNLAYFAFSRGKYDEAILQYLIRYYTGPSKDLYAIWKAAKDFEVPAFELEERLLCEILFAGTLMDKGGDVFVSYYAGRPGQRLVKAFFASYSHEYLLDHQDMSLQIVQLMEIELEQMEQAKDICALALLKYYANSDTIEPEYFEELRQKAAGFMDRGIILPFFARYAGSVVVPGELADCVYVEHHADPEKTVRIHYRIQGYNEEKFFEEPMRQVFDGIFISMFRLYGNEELIYYITETGGNDETVFEQKVLKAPLRTVETVCTGMDYVNRMYDCVEFHDDLAMDEAMRACERLDEMTDQLFELK